MSWPSHVILESHPSGLDVNAMDSRPMYLVLLFQIIRAERRCNIRTFAVIFTLFGPFKQHSDSLLILRIDALHSETKKNIKRP
jgi:hypothetical protein